MDYSAKGSYIDVNEMKTCRFEFGSIVSLLTSQIDRTGPSDAETGIIIVYVSPMYNPAEQPR